MESKRDALDEDDVPELSAESDNDEAEEADDDEVKEPPKKKQKQLAYQFPSRWWELTDFKMTTTEDDWKRYVRDGLITGVAWGVEMCPKTNRKHRQMVIYKKSKIRYKAAQKMVGYECWLKPCDHFANKAVGYTQKAETNVEGYFKFGSLPSEAGQRTDIEQAWSAAKEAKGNMKMMIEQAGPLFLKYHAGMTKVTKELEEPPDYRHVKIYLLNGEGGLGKTHYAQCGHDKNDTYILNKDIYKAGAWRGYKQQKRLILDEFTPPWMEAGVFNGVCEGHPLSVNVLYSYEWAKWTEVFITTNRSKGDYNLYPELWKKFPKMRRAFNRRVAKGGALEFVGEWTCKHCGLGKPSCPTVPRLTIILGC